MGAGIENQMCLFGLQSVPAHPQSKTMTSASMQPPAPHGPRVRRAGHTPDDLGQESRKQPPSAPWLRYPQRSRAGSLHPPSLTLEASAVGPQENRARTQQASCCLWIGRRAHLTTLSIPLLQRGRAESKFAGADPIARPRSAHRHRRGSITIHPLMFSK